MKFRKVCTEQEDLEHKRVLLLRRMLRLWWWIVFWCLPPGGPDYLYWSEERSTLVPPPTTSRHQPPPRQAKLYSNLQSFNHTAAAWTCLRFVSVAPESATTHSPQQYSKMSWDTFLLPLRTWRSLEEWRRRRGHSRPIEFHSWIILQQLTSFASRWCWWWCYKLSACLPSGVLHSDAPHTLTRPPLL